MSALACGQKLTRFGDTSTLANMALVIPACVVPFRDDPFIEVWLTPGKSARLDPGSVKELALRKTDEASTRIENHKMLGSADKDAVKHQGWKQTVFAPFRNARCKTHWSHKPEIGHSVFTDPQFLRWQIGKCLLCFTKVAFPEHCALEKLNSIFTGAFEEDRAVTARIQLQKDVP